jgi:hypothetical protein
VIRNGRRREKAGELEPTVSIRHAHHGNLDALIAQSSDTAGPFSFDRGPPFELEAELEKEINRRSQIIDDDSYIVHPFERHVSNLRDVAWSNGTRRAWNGQTQPLRPPLRLESLVDPVKL